MLQYLDYCIRSSVPTYAHGVCVYIVIDGERRGEGEGWRDRIRGE